MVKQAQQRHGDQCDPVNLRAAIQEALIKCPIKQIIPVLPWREIPAKAAPSGILRITMVLGGKRHVRWPEKNKNVFRALTRGEALVVTPMAWTQNKTRERHRVLCIDCFPTFTRFMVNGIHGGRRYPRDGIFLSGGTMAPTARALLNALAQVAATEDQERMKPIFHCFINEVLNECRVWENAPSGLNDWQHAVSIIHDEAHVDLHREYLAERIGVHPNHLSRLCKKFTKQSLADYLTTVRMERACHYLRDPERSIRDVMVFAGYHDETHFRKRFKLVFGQTPGQWRKSQHAYTM